MEETITLKAKVRYELEKRDGDGGPVLETLIFTDGDHPVIRRLPDGTEEIYHGAD